MSKQTSSLFSKTKIIILSISLVLIGSIIAYSVLLSPISKDSEEVNFLVSPNDNLTTITKNLEKQDIIKSATVTKLSGKISGIDNFVEGAFTLDKSWSAKNILDYLTVSKNVIKNEVSVTLREGLWAKEIASILASKVDVTEDEFLSLWNDADYIKSLMLDYPFLTDDVLNDVLKVKLEGYLAPNTYNFFIDSSADDITRKILNQTLIIYNKYLDEFLASEYSIHEIFTLASLTQYESGDFEEDQIIAGIWYNRLDLGMKLESSVTVCYSLYEFDNWEDCETNTQIDSPYNTYRNAGIVPGPVTNPGESSIVATLKPMQTDYLFFLADVYNDGQIYYSKTFAEHAIKVKKYLR